MPILNIDIPALADEFVAESKRADFDKLRVSDQLTELARIAHNSGRNEARDQALAAALKMSEPAYIGVNAVRITVKTCCSLNQIPIEQNDMLVAALSSTDAQVRHDVGKWHRNPEGRWWLQVTAEDMRQAMLRIREAKKSSSSPSF